MSLGRLHLVRKALHLGGWRACLFLWLIAAPILFAASVSHAAVHIDWVASTVGVAIAVDAQDNVYTTNYEYNPGGDITLTKRDATGLFLWEAGFDQTAPSNWERASWMEVDSQGNVVVSGTLMSGYSNPVTAASLLMKFSPEGDLLWRKVYESSFDGSYTTKCLIDGFDDIYVLGMGAGPAGFTAKVKKFDADGVAQWTYHDEAGIGAPNNFKFTPDGALVIAARAIFGSVNGYAKIDLDGHEVWSLPGIQSLTVGDVAGDRFGNAYVVHGEYVTNGGTVVRKIDPFGGQTWSDIYPLSAFRVETGSDDWPVIAGFPGLNTAGASFVKLDGDGGVIWSNSSGDGGLGLLLHAQLRLDAADNAYLAAGTLFEMAVCKVGSDGTSQWTATIPGGYARAIDFGDAAVYVVGGRTARLVEDDVTSLPFGDEAVMSGTLDVFPNPVREMSTVRYQLANSSHVRLDLIDARGRCVRGVLDKTEASGEHQVQVPTTGLPAGVYYYRLHYGANVETARVTVIR